MSFTPKNETPPEAAPPANQALIGSEAEELRKQVMAHVREFGPRKYLAFYSRAKELIASGLDATAIRRNLIGEVRSDPPVPEGGVQHFITTVHHEKQIAFFHVVRNAVEDALARRPPQFREDYALAN